MPHTDRRSGRVPLTVACQIQGPPETVRVPVRDISLDGVRLVCAKSREVGDVMKVTLGLPTRIELPAEVRWVKRDDSKEVYTVGCRFVHADGSRQALKDILRNMAGAIDSAARRVK